MQIYHMVYVCFVLAKSQTAIWKAGNGSMHMGRVCPVPVVVVEGSHIYRLAVFAYVVVPW